MGGAFFNRKKAKTIFSAMFHYIYHNMHVPIIINYSMPSLHVESIFYLLHDKYQSNIKSSAE